MFELQLGIHFFQAKVFRLQFFQALLVIVLLCLHFVFPFVERRRADLMFFAKRFNRLVSLEITLQNGLTLAFVKSAFSHAGPFLSVKVTGLNFLYLLLAPISGGQDNRIDVHWSVFAIAGVLAVLVAFLTVGVQSLRAALANPVQSLKSE